MLPRTAQGPAAPALGISTRAARMQCRAQPRVDPPKLTDEQDSTRAALGLVFEPIQAVQPQLDNVTTLDPMKQSYARVDFGESLEQAINEQISIEYNISYLYHSLHNFFARDTIGLPGFARYFDDASTEERLHAQKLMYLQNVRGGRVKLLSISTPETEFYHDVKGEALFAMELSLSLEKLNFQKLRALHDVAVSTNDAQVTDFVESNLLQEQARDVKRAADFVSQLRRLGAGHGTWHFDRYLNAGNYDNLSTVAAFPGGNMEAGGPLPGGGPPA